MHQLTFDVLGDRFHRVSLRVDGDEERNHIGHVRIIIYRPQQTQWDDRYMKAVDRRTGGRWEEGRGAFNWEIGG